ncbi:RagB/SusD family nutrient uptake outer membrane protein [Elizabethkingia argentiflava]|uniref:RagB/SusD family nutrient uptake outer membrane protein n=1 Tax=Elizabethkingia argenteiflava TaxID=2681556 RepID=A0A845PYD9_9FLAO|nr:RagB/SusD family nutrient uptake outer membrane protein [Elizabethkingia argenteiflava]NAW52303.1 RagB/SusD family nutrient uptake outer membrane protein [Elizabethkingia argenteiflava]
MKKSIINILITGLLILILGSCSRDFVETKFYQDKKAGQITSLAELHSFMSGVYVQMRVPAYYGANFLAFGEMHSDGMFVTGKGGHYVGVASYSMNSNTSNVVKTWDAMYQTVRLANEVINVKNEQFSDYSKDPQAVIAAVNNYKAQAYAVRAQVFFDVLRLYGQKYTNASNWGAVLPLTVDTDRKQARATIAETQAQIEKDFKNALEFIKDVNGSPIRLNETSIKALMTRYYLYKKDYAKVRQLANDVIGKKVYSVLTANNLLKAYKTDLNEDSIFEIAVGVQSSNGTSSYDSYLNSDAYASIGVLNSTLDFYEPQDIRLKLIYKHPKTGRLYLDNKFPRHTGEGNIKMMRYEELLLNAAEAELNGGSSAKAMDYYNQIRKNRGLASSSKVTLEDIKKERMRELLGEGFRFWDLLRWNAVIPYYDQRGDRIESRDKQIPDNLLAFPIPSGETNVKNSPVQPNPGYDNFK